MSDHAIIFTLPRSGPHLEHPGLRAAGFTPVPSEKTPCFTCWVKHIWHTCITKVALEAADIADEFPDMQFCLVDEDGKAIDICSLREAP